MATVNKDFKIKSGLIVEGTTATVNGYDILTKKPADDQYIIDIIGGETLVKSVSNEFYVSVAGELSIDRAVVDAYYDAAGDAAAAQAAAEATASADATSKANAAQAAAEATASADATSKANAAQAAAEATASADATSKANAAQAAAEATASADATSKANAAQAAAEATAASDATSKANAAEAAANLYTDGAVSALVDSAPELLNTLNELAEALGDSPDTITNLATLVGTKADTSYVDTEISDLDTAAQGYASAAQTAAEATASADATSKANAAQAAAEATASADATSKANAAEANAIAHADALDTDDIAEGSAQYFTDARAKSSAADLILGASLTNIAITGNSTTGLIIVAENGVADSDTDDLVEGSTNLYFTDVRALGAIDGANIQPESIDITWVRREEATWTDVNTASKVTCHSAGTSEGSMKYLVRVTAQVGGVRHSHVTEVLATVAGNNGVAVVEYGTIYTSENPLATVTVEWNAGTSAYDLNVTTANNNSEVMVAATLISALD
jgi:chemotaxis protein histidine kinase CheA